MKKLLLMTAVLALAACGEKKADEAPPAETTGEMAAPADTGMGGMSHDSAAMSDTTMAVKPASSRHTSSWSSSASITSWLRRLRRSLVLRMERS